MQYGGCVAKYYFTYFDGGRVTYAEWRFFDNPVFGLDGTTYYQADDNIIRKSTRSSFQNEMFGFGEEFPKRSVLFLKKYKCHSNSFPRAFEWHLHLNIQFKPYPVISFYPSASTFYVVFVNVDVAQIQRNRPQRNVYLLPYQIQMINVCWKPQVCIRTALVSG